jgi:transcriptional regulator with XRE-family HTH domain
MDITIGFWKGTNSLKMKSNILPSNQSKQIIDNMLSLPPLEQQAIVFAMLSGYKSALQKLGFPKSFYNHADDKTAVQNIVFDWLYRQETILHEQLTFAYETIFAKAFKERRKQDGLSHNLLAQIMGIVSKHRTGLSSQFLNQKQQESQDDPVLELDLLLLYLKAKEKSPEFVVLDWAAEFANSPKPHFKIAALYLLMRADPEAALSNFWNLAKSGWYDPRFDRHLNAYGFIAVYNFLQHPGNYENFAENYSSVEEIAWAKTLLDNFLSKPSLKMIWDQHLQLIQFVMHNKESEEPGVRKPTEAGPPPLSEQKPSEQTNWDEIHEQIKKLVSMVANAGSDALEQQKELSNHPLARHIIELLQGKTISDGEDKVNQELNNYRLWFDSFNGLSNMDTKELVFDISSERHEDLKSTPIHMILEAVNTIMSPSEN